MRYFLLPLVLFAALIGLSVTPASAASAVPGLHVTPSASIVQADWRWNGHNYHHRRWRNHRWYYYN